MRDSTVVISVFGRVTISSSGFVTQVRFLFIREIVVNFEFRYKMIFNASFAT